MEVFISAVSAELVQQKVIKIIFINSLLKRIRMQISYLTL